MLPIQDIKGEAAVAYIANSGHRRRCGIVGRVITSGDPLHYIASSLYIYPYIYLKNCQLNISKTVEAS